MTGTNRVLAEQTLASRFYLMITTVNCYGEEIEHSIKMKKKEDFKIDNLKAKVHKNYMLDKKTWSIPTRFVM